MIRLLLVDDEPPARAKLRRFLAEREDVRVVHEAADGEEALAWLSSPGAPPVDAVLLDIQMPGLSGLQVAAALPSAARVVFLTAHDEHAVRAFELDAVDYLLKPYTRERLMGCIDRLHERLAPDEVARQRQRLATAWRTLQPVDRHWLVADRGTVHRVDLDAVECVEAADNYIELHGASTSWLDRHTLAAFLDHPQAAGRFVRVHRSAAVRLAHVAAIEPLERGDALLVMASGRRVRLSRRYRDAVTAGLPGRAAD